MVVCRLYYRNFGRCLQMPPHILTYTALLRNSSMNYTIPHQWSSKRMVLHKDCMSLHLLMQKSLENMVHK